MRTTVILDDHLLSEARELMAGATLRAVIEGALRETVRRGRREQLIGLMGSGIVELSDRELENLRSADPSGG